MKATLTQIIKSFLDLGPSSEFLRAPARLGNSEIRPPPEKNIYILSIVLNYGHQTPLSAALESFQSRSPECDEKILVASKWYAGAQSSTCQKAFSCYILSDVRMPGQSRVEKGSEEKKKVEYSEEKSRVVERRMHSMSSKVRLSVYSMKCPPGNDHLSHQMGKGKSSTQTCRLRVGYVIVPRRVAKIETNVYNI